MAATPPHRPIVAGDVVLIRARVRAVSPPFVSVRIATPGSWGGPGFRQDVLPLAAVAALEDEPPDDERLVPPASSLR